MPCRASRTSASLRRSDGGPTDGIVLRPLIADARRQPYHTRMRLAALIVRRGAVEGRGPRLHALWPKAAA